MSLSDLASLGSFVSGVAVIATLVFLILQMRQTHRNQRALMQQGRSNRLMQGNILLADPYQSDLRARAVAGETNFTSAEVLSIMSTNAAWFWTFEDSYLQHKASLLDEAGWNTDLNTLRALLTEPASRCAWRLLRGYAGGPYAEFVDKLMKEIEPRAFPELSQAWKAMMTEEWSHCQE